MSKTNNFVTFLRHYGPISSSDNMYDELIQAQIEKYSIDPPVKIQPSRLDDIIQNFKRADPYNVILTGTAGDGKTYHCRRVWEVFNGDKKTWSRGDKFAKLGLPSSGKILTVVKDLSELTENEKAGLFPNMCKALTGELVDSVYLIAANDGQLLSTFREWAEKQDSKVLSVFRKVEAMLVDERETDQDICLNLYNLSRMDPSRDFDALLSEVINHPQWLDCKGCSLYPSEDETTCPIRINRRLLIGSTAESPFRKKLGELISLAAANRLHLPIRHLLLLVVNILLGDQKPPNYLLTCRSAQNRADADEYDRTNPYANAFGGNLPMSRRRQYQVFTVLDTFGVGRETDNAFDNLLIYGSYNDQNRYKQIVGNDEYYGANSSYKYLLEDYLEGTREFESSFMRRLERQRQRLFFFLGENESLSPWHLTVYRFAGSFLNFCKLPPESREYAGIKAKLVRGLNRTFCGMMIDDTTKLSVASSGGDGRGQIAQILSHEIDARANNPRAVYLSFKQPGKHPIPHISVVDPLDLGKPVVCEMPLYLTHFEYLMRVAQGSLPASFSRQCYEDFLDFKVRLIEELDQIFGQDKDPNGMVEFRIISVEENGKSNVKEISIERNW